MKKRDLIIETDGTNERGTELMPLEALQSSISILYAMLRIDAQLGEGMPVMPVAAKAITKNNQTIFGAAACEGMSPCRYDLHDPPIHPEDCLAPVPFTEWQHKTTGDRVMILYTAAPGGLKKTIEWPKWAIDCIPPGHLVVVFTVLDAEPIQEWTTLGRFLELFQEAAP
jgi:hypothetical protein